MSQQPRPFSRWKHPSGTSYTVLFVLNRKATKADYPCIVAYLDDAGGLWGRRLENWPGSLTPMLPEQAPALVLPMRGQPVFRHAATGDLYVRVVLDGPHPVDLDGAPLVRLQAARDLVDSTGEPLPRRQKTTWLAPHQELIVTQPQFATAFKPMRGIAAMQHSDGDLLLAEYAKQGFDFGDLPGVATAALRHAPGMSDRFGRALMEVLAGVALPTLKVHAAVA